MQARHALFLSTLFLSAAALAGEPPAPPVQPAPAGAVLQHHPTPEQMVRHMDKRADLKLSEAQKQQMQAALADKREKMRAVHEESKARMAQILTPEQQAKLDKSRDDLRQRRSDRMERHAERMQARAEALKAGVAVPLPAPASPQ